MVYEKTQWNSGSAPGISAQNLNKIEEGINRNSRRIMTVGVGEFVNDSLIDFTVGDLIPLPFAFTDTDNLTSHFDANSELWTAPYDMTVNLNGTLALEDVGLRVEVERNANRVWDRIRFEEGETNSVYFEADAVRLTAGDTLGFRLLNRTGSSLTTTSIIGFFTRITLDIVDF